MNSSVHILQFFFSWGYIEPNALGAFQTYSTVLNKTKTLFWFTIGVCIVGVIVFEMARKYKGAWNEKLSIYRAHRSQEVIVLDKTKITLQQTIQVEEEEAV